MLLLIDFLDRECREELFQKLPVDPSGSKPLTPAVSQPGGESDQRNGRRMVHGPTRPSMSCSQGLTYL